MNERCNQSELIDVQIYVQTHDIQSLIKFWHLLYDIHHAQWPSTCTERFCQVVGSLWQMSYLTNLSLYTFRSMYRYIIYKVWSSLDTYFIISIIHHQHLHSLPIIGKFLSTCSFLEGGTFVTDEIYGREIDHLNALDEIRTNVKRSCYDCEYNKSNMDISDFWSSSRCAGECTLCYINK